MPARHAAASATAYAAEPASTGTPNDSRVSVALYMTPGTAPATPKWDGTDAWPVRPESLVMGMGTDPILLDKNAYAPEPAGLWFKGVRPQ